MKRETFFLKAVVVLMGLPVVALCIFIIPEIAAFLVELVPSLTYLQYPFMIGLYASAGIYFVALHQVFKLLGYIDMDLAFSDLTVQVLKNIKLCAAAIGGLFILFMPLIFMMGDLDDAPGLVLIGLIIIFACMVIAVFAAVLQKLLKNAIAIKQENDYTI